MYRDPKEREIEYYLNQLADLQDRQRREQEEAYQRREAERQQRRQEWQERQLYADDWNDGFAKGLPRARNEARAEAVDNEKAKNDPAWADYKTYDFFAQWVADLERGQIVYNEEANAAQTEIERLEAEIEKVRQSILSKTADRLEAEDRDSELIQALREDNPNYLTNW